MKRELHALPPLSLNAWLRYDSIRTAMGILKAGSTVLEVGAGQGGLGARFARQYRYTGVEPDPESARVARPRIEAEGGIFIEGRDRDLPQAAYNAVCAFEVLEHLEDDAEALRLWTKQLAVGGWLFISVPAFQQRFAAADRAVGHVRRYDPAVLVSRLTDTGLSNVELWMTGFPFGLLLEFGRNVLANVINQDIDMPSRTLCSGRWWQPPAALAPATEILSLPFRLLQRPFANTQLGTGLVARGQLLRISE